MRSSDGRALPTRQAGSQGGGQGEEELAGGGAAEAGLVVVMDEPVGESEGVQEIVVGGGFRGLIESVAGGGKGAFEESEFLGK